jgi:hypothetical protein
MTVTNPKQQRASREPLIWVAIGRSGDRPWVMRFDHRLLDVQGIVRRGIGGFGSLDSTRIEAWERRREAGWSLQLNHAPNGTFKK